MFHTSSLQLLLLLQIYGLFLVKLAVAITLIGGCARRDDSGTHIRGECHMLLIGDPGTGKSQVRNREGARAGCRHQVSVARPECC